MPEYVTADEIAKRFRIKPDTVRAWVRHKRIPAVRVGPRGLIRIDPADVEKFIATAWQEAE